MPSRTTSVFIMGSIRPVKAESDFEDPTTWRDLYINTQFIIELELIREAEPGSGDKDLYKIFKSNGGGHSLPSRWYIKDTTGSIKEFLRCSLYRTTMI